MTLVQKLDISFNISQLQTECTKLISEIGVDSLNNQLCLMHSSKCQHVWFDGTGSLRLKSTQMNENDYSIINKNLANWYLGDVLKELVIRFNISRARLMLMKPRYCYSWHRDSCNRLHIAINTNKNCLLAFENGCFHIPTDGFLYRTITTQFHSAFNGDNKESRLHLVCNDSTVIA
jgi:hypothetical protein